MASLRRALELAAEEGAGAAELEPIHFQLGQALRRVGPTEEAAAHLTEAGRLAARRRDPPGASRPRRGNRRRGAGRGRRTRRPGSGRSNGSS